MSLYERSYELGRCRRWNPETGEWIECAYDEPETRVRKPREGMIVMPWGRGEIRQYVGAHWSDGEVIRLGPVDSPADG